MLNVIKNRMYVIKTVHGQKLEASSMVGPCTDVDPMFIVSGPIGVNSVER